MKKEYNLKIEDNQGTWNVTFEAKTKGSLIKRALIQTLWDSEPLTIKSLMEKLIHTGKKVSNTISHQRLSNIIRGCKMFEVVSNTITGGNDSISNFAVAGVGCWGGEYMRGSSYKVFTYKLNKDYLKYELIE